MTDLLTGMRNEGAVAGSLLSTAPDAVWQEISNDWNRSPVEFVANTALSAAAGFGAELFLCRSPAVLAVVAGTYLLGTTVYHASGHFPGIGNYFSRAWHANTTEQRNAIVQDCLPSFARQTASLLEQTGGALFGAGLGRAYSRYVLQDSLALVTNWNLRNRATLQERMSFIGNDTMHIPRNVLSPRGDTVDLVRLAEMMREPWTGVERARSVDIAMRRVSRAEAGTPTAVDLGYPDRPGRILFHSHSEVTGPHPGLFDAAGTHDLGIIHSGNRTTYYLGQGRQFRTATERLNLSRLSNNEIAAQLGENQIGMRALVMDNATQRAYLLEQQWSGGRLSWQSTVQHPVDYHAARQTLSSFNLARSWEQLQAIPRLPTAQSTPLAAVTRPTG